MPRKVFLYTLSTDADNAERYCGAFVALEVLKMNEMCSFLKNVHYQGVT